MADRETLKLLQDWEMPEDIIKNFTDAGIDCVVLENMLESDWSVLMPDLKNMGYRVKFRMCWQSWVQSLKNRCSTPSSSNTYTTLLSHDEFIATLAFPSTSNYDQSTQYNQALLSQSDPTVHGNLSASGSFTSQPQPLCSTQPPKPTTHNYSDPIVHGNLSASGSFTSQPQPLYSTQLPKPITHNYFQSDPIVHGNLSASGSFTSQPQPLYSTQLPKPITHNYVSSFFLLFHC
ncbi:uncharacterized protein LOC103521195 isoform X3 [Diaphorina citri]|uniref:Uncharacterized protein LOC103521195 isoform X3 n=1 Tax=Diaphorina citri TaxID=121845 RepID=A0A3Q0JKZ7_DIACI|nr:uncharacterized protein LOC103521195 isoform X3 [Diaphorina citri]